MKVEGTQGKGGTSLGAGGESIADNIEYVVNLVRTRGEGSFQSYEQDEKRREAEQRQAWEQERAEKFKQNLKFFSSFMESFNYVRQKIGLPTIEAPESDELKVELTKNIDGLFNVLKNFTYTSSKVPVNSPEFEIITDGFNKLKEFAERATEEGWLRSLSIGFLEALYNYISTQPTYYYFDYISLRRLEGYIKDHLNESTNSRIKVLLDPLLMGVV